MYGKELLKKGGITMITIKKVRVEPLDINYGKIINSLNTSDDKTRNAPSISAVESGLVEYTPVGSISLYSAATAPSGWLLCRGQAVSRSTYNDLFSVIGTTYGSGNGSTTFNLPNLQGNVPVGLNSSDASFDSLGEKGGEKTHTLNVAEMPGHRHKLFANEDSGAIFYEYPDIAVQGHVGGENNYVMASSDHGAIWGNSSETGSGYAHNNIQPYIVLNYIIKY